jgi:hypothetical protein
MTLGTRIMNLLPVLICLCFVALAYWRFINPASTNLAKIKARIHISRKNTSRAGFHFVTDDAMMKIKIKM